MNKGVFPSLPTLLEINFRDNIETNKHAKALTTMINNKVRQVFDN